MPGSLLSQYSLRYAGSVPPSSVTRRCSADKRATASGFLLYVCAMTASFHATAGRSGLGDLLVLCATAPANSYAHARTLCPSTWLPILGRGSRVRAHRQPD